MKYYLTILLLLLPLSANSQTAKEALSNTVLRLRSGSGSVVRLPDGRKIGLTNWHVILSSKFDGYVRAAYPDGSSFSGRSIKDDPQSDLSAFEAPSEAPSLVLAKRFDSEERIATKGYPEGVFMFSEGFVKHTRVFDLPFSIYEIGECPSGFRKLYSHEGPLWGCGKDFSNAITTLYARPGSSGSAVVDSHGDLVGVIETWDPNDGAGMLEYKVVKRFLEGL